MFSKTSHNIKASYSGNATRFRQNHAFIAKRSRQLFTGASVIILQSLTVQRGPIPDDPHGIGHNSRAA